MEEFDRLVAEGDEAYKKDDYGKAVLSYEQAFKIATELHKNKLKPILPMMGRCYRQRYSPRSVINLAAEAKAKFGSDIISTPFLTTIAAAYADLNEFGNAHKCVKVAIERENGNISMPLQMLIDRLEK